MRAVCIALAVMAFAAPAAFGQSSYKTSTTVFDLQQQQSPISLDSSLIYVSGTGVRLANSATSGVAGFYGTDAPFPVNNVVCSWNVDMPPEQASKRKCALSTADPALCGLRSPAKALYRVITVIRAPGPTESTTIR